MPQNNDVYIIRRSDQLAALRAPTRQEIVDVLAPMGEASIADLAAALGRPADALYYHIRILQRVGLVVSTGERMAGGHKETLFQTIAPDLRLGYRPGKDGNSRNVSPIIASMLRMTNRDFSDAFSDSAVAVDGKRRELWAARVTGWLTEHQLESVNRYIAELRKETTKSSSMKGRLYALTLVLTPLNKRSHRAGTKE